MSILKKQILLNYKESVDRLNFDGEIFLNSFRSKIFEYILTHKLQSIFVNK
jgi:hypothetical protein